MKKPLWILGVLIALALSALAGLWFHSAKREPAAAGVSSSAAPVTQANPQAMLKEALALEAQGKTSEADTLYYRAAAEDLESMTGRIAKAKLDAGGLEAYVKTLGDTNSEIYEVKAGDNLTAIGKKFQVTAGSLRRLNGIKGDLIHPGMKLKVMKEKWSLWVSKSLNVLALSAGNEIVKVYPVATGKNNSTPVGVFKTENHLVNPSWYYEGKKYEPLAPDNPLGTRWIGFDLKSYGVHGTNDPNIIGQYATMGCVRMLNSDVEEIYDLIPPGTTVTIVES